MSRFCFSLANEFLRLRTPLVVGGVKTEEREVVYVGAAALDDPDFPQRLGEAAPLPGLHTETIDDVMDAFEGDAQDAVFADTLADCAALLAGEPSSLRFALESVWLGWRAHQQETVPARVLNADARDRVAVCALVSADGKASVPAAAQAVKVKVGRLDADRERQALAKLLDGLSEDIEVRLDANRAWSLDEAVKRLEGLDADRIAFVEEPLADPQALPALHEQTGLRVALDESLHEPGHAGLCEAPSVAAYVVKPSRCGIHTTLAWDGRAATNGKRVIVSSCFESGIGVSMLAQVAAALQTAAGAAGLGTLGWFDPPPAAPGYDGEALEFAIDDWMGT